MTRLPMTFSEQRRKLVAGIIALLALPLLAACQSRDMAGPRGSDSGDDQDSGGMSGGGTNY